MLPHSPRQKDIEDSNCRDWSWMPTDSLWSFCMAVNIYLAFYRRYSAEDLKRLEKWYLLLCYGLPLILATALSLIKTSERGRIYGPALVGTWSPCRLPLFMTWIWFPLDLVLNCRTVAVPSPSVLLWSSVVWSRNNFSQQLVWFYFRRVVSIVTFAIYVTAGIHIYRKYRALHVTKETLPVSGVIEVTRSFSFNAETATAEDLVVEPATPYSTCIESQQFQAGSGLDIRMNTNNAIWSYLRYSFLFFIAMVATWVWICSSLLMTLPSILIITLRFGMPPNS